MSANYTLGRKVLTLHIPILICLFLLTDNDTYTPSYIIDETEQVDENQQSKYHHSSRHLAVITALQRHPPSARIFRCFLEVALLGICASVSLYVFSTIMDYQLLGHLLFRVPYTMLEEEEEALDRDHVVDRGGFELVKRGGDHDAKNGDDDEEHEDVGVEGGTLEYEESEGENEGIIDDKVASHNALWQQIQAKSSSESSIEYPHTTTASLEYLHSSILEIPTVSTILNITLDFSLWTLVTLFFFTLSSSAGGQYIDQFNIDKSQYPDKKYTTQFFFAQFGQIAAWTFPLLLFLFVIYKLFIPWTQPKKQFWTVISYTLGAPLYDVTFRDGFIGDVFTSTVRPLQDMAFTCFYLASGLQGWFIYQSSPAEEDILQPVEKSWLLHTFVLPACMISPLWWRYCQTLRQVYDERKRWPYLGNSAKYFFAAQIAMFGVFDPNVKERWIWIIGFVLCTLYQFWWDVFMDWELLVRCPDSTTGYRLRKERLYSSRMMYYTIFIINFILRFGWVATMIPNSYLSPSGILLHNFSGDYTAFIAPILASAEIIRRTLWGFLRVELEALKVTKRIGGVVEVNPNTESSSSRMDGRDEMEDLEPMSIGSTNKRIGNSIMTSLGSNLKGSSTITMKNDVSSASEIEMLWELSIYALAFTALGMAAAVYRQVM